jgi:hypothetical protein
MVWGVTAFTNSIKYPNGSIRQVEIIKIAPPGKYSGYQPMAEYRRNGDWTLVRITSFATTS